MARANARARVGKPPARADARAGCPSLSRRVRSAHADEPYEFLRGVPLFSDVSDKDLQTIAVVHAVLRVRSG